MSKKSSIAALKRVLSKHPTDISTLTQLAEKYRLAGNIDDACHIFNQLLRVSPDNYQALNNYGALLRTNNKLEESLSVLLKANTLLPNSPIILTNLSNTYESMGRCELSIEKLHYVITTNPDFFDAYMALATSYTSIGKDQDSIECLNIALSIKPDDANVISTLASKYFHEKNYDKAYQLIKPLIKSNSPECAAVYFNISDKLGMREQAVSYLNKIIRSKKYNSTSISALHFCLGKHYDQAKDYDNAMQHYQKGNKLCKRTFDIDSISGPFSRIIEVYSQTNNKTFDVATNQSLQPIFIVGMPRSGTSLLEQIIAAHPCVYGAGELINIDVTFKEAANKHGEIYSSDVIKKLNSYELESIANDYISYINKLSGNAERVTDKMPHNFMHIGFITHLFPKAKIINCIRHPLDTCLSCYFSNFGNTGHDYAYNLKDTANYYLEYDRLMSHWLAIFGNKILQVHYDDVINHQEITSKKIINFCELNWDDNCLNYYNNDRKVRTFSYDQANRPIYTSSLSRWKNYKSHINDVKNILTECISKYEANTSDEKQV